MNNSEKIEPNLENSKNDHKVSNTSKKVNLKANMVKEIHSKLRLVGKKRPKFENIFKLEEYKTFEISETPAKR